MMGGGFSFGITLAQLPVSFVEKKRSVYRTSYCPQPAETHALFGVEPSQLQFNIITITKPKQGYIQRRKTIYQE